MIERKSDRQHDCDCPDRGDDRCPRHGAVAPREHESAKARAKAQEHDLTPNLAAAMSIDDFAERLRVYVSAGVIESARTKDDKERAAALLAACRYGLKADLLARESAVAARASRGARAEVRLSAMQAVKEVGEADIASLRREMRAQGASDEAAAVVDLIIGRIGLLLNKQCIAIGLLEI